MRVHLSDEPGVVVREESGAISVLADRCRHMGGPLSQGMVAESRIRCPWHGSTFRPSGSWNTTGSATAAQPAFESRVCDGRVEARLQRLYGTEAGDVETEL